MPIILVESQVCFHALNRNDEALDDFLAHGLVHRAEVLFHLVQSLDMIQVALVFGFFNFFLLGITSVSSCSGALLALAHLRHLAGHVRWHLDRSVLGAHWVLRGAGAGILDVVGLGRLHRLDALDTRHLARVVRDMVHVVPDLVFSSHLDGFMRAHPA